MKTNLTRFHFSFLVFLGLVGISIFFFSCKKDKEPDTLDEESAYIVDLQEDFAGVFNSLLSSLDTVAAADSVYRLFLKDDHVLRGKVTKQAIFIDYRDGTRGGIFYDSQDSPDEEFSFSDELKISPEKSIKNTKPTSNKAVFINPHYWERVKVSNRLSGNYEDLLPLIGYEEPEKYLNEGCTLELFTRLSNYGLIHIYSHGMRYSDDLVYLMTGEEINVSAIVTYKQFRAEKKLICITRSKNKQTLFFISPEFIQETNNLNTSKPLVIGGFCYSYLGGWPEMFEGAGSAGYFGFDWAVSNLMHAFWSESIIEYLTDYSFDGPYSASWWMQSAPVVKQYWASGHDRMVKIKYNGESDLVLWDWGLFDLDFNSFDLWMKVDATIKNSEGETNNETWNIPFYLGHTVDLTANQLQSSWHTEPIQSGFHTGRVEITVSPSGKNIIDFQLNDTVYFSGMNEVTKIILKIQLKGLPMVSENDGLVVFEAKGPDACLFIDKLEYRLGYQVGIEPETWEMITDYNCVFEDAIVTLKLFR